MRIAISGVGTSVGIGIIKSIRKDSEEHFILGIDNVKSAQSFMVDKFECMEEVEYLENCDHIIKLINLHKIDVLLISSEYEISWFSKNKEPLTKLGQDEITKLARVGLAADFIKAKIRENEKKK